MLPFTLIKPIGLLDNYCVIDLLLFLTRHLRRMMFLLQTSDLSVRIAAGELLALMYELGRNVQHDFGYRDRNGVCDLIRELATEGTKHIAKKDLRQQRSSFRDILKTIEVLVYTCHSREFFSSTVFP